jgi:hypothetical protein
VRVLFITVEIATKRGRWCVGKMMEEVWDEEEEKRKRKGRKGRKQGRKSEE